MCVRKCVCVFACVLSPFDEISLKSCYGRIGDQSSGVASTEIAKSVGSGLMQRYGSKGKQTKVRKDGGCVCIFLSSLDCVCLFARACLCIFLFFFFTFLSFFAKRLCVHVEILQVYFNIVIKNIL